VYDQDDVTSGKAPFPLASLDAGVHEFKVVAWDNANNLSVTEFSLEIVGSSDLAIYDLLNYPNPMSHSTTFYFTLTQPTERFSLEIFTTAGRKIWTSDHFGLTADSYPNDAVSVVWDGRDADGDRVATGVYIYKASATSSRSDGEVELFGKVVIVN
jgi:flagellar hook assembly protein FlgD